MECPVCGLVNPPEAMRCDCGYDFTSGTVEKSYITKASQLPPGPPRVGLGPPGSPRVGFSPWGLFGWPILLCTEIVHLIRAVLARAHILSLPPRDEEKATDIVKRGEQGHGDPRSDAKIADSITRKDRDDESRLQR